MNYKDITINYSYVSQGDINIADSFLNPLLKCTKEYKRSVGFFSSGVFDTIMPGIISMAKNGGHIKLIASPKLSEKDVEAINYGYEQRKKYCEKVFSDDFKNELDKLTEKNLQVLAELIKKSILDIKIAVTDGCGIYHDKLGVMKDFEGNTIVFYGSSNSSYSGYRSNYEKIRISKEWDPGFEDIVKDEEKEFDSLWNNTNEFVEVYEFTSTAEKDILEIIEKKESSKPNTTIKLRDYQEEAINAWVKNDYHGFYVMATGTGKTWTAIFSAKRLIEDGKNCLITICAPYKHLIKQWAEDIEKVFPDAKIILVSSENPGWDKQISNEIVHSKYDAEKQIIVISTIASFKMSKFTDTINKYKGNKLLIVDEAHRFTVRPNGYEFMLGLSATPFSGTSATKGKELMEYFGGQVFSLPIEEALDKGFLVPYYYRPIYVYSTSTEEEKFKSITKMILGCFKNGKCVKPDDLVIYLRSRLRIIAMSDNKQLLIDDIINTIEEKDHVVVYCGDGKLFDNDLKEEIKHITSVKKALVKHEYKPSQFTATENMSERIQLVDSFNKGQISALAAIRCLDEGINIPSIKSAVILSSNDDYREFVQRRGRILRKYDGKDFATIYDVIVMPSNEMKQWAIIELRRFREYAKLSLNWEELKEEFEDYLIQYGLSYEDVDVFDYDDMEVENDE